MERWGSRLYGDPCRECGWRWGGDPVDGIDYVRGLPARYGGLLAGFSGTEQCPDLTWSASGYVCHVADNLRLWAERVAGVLRGGDAHVGGYDPDALAAARDYARVSLPAALWSLETSVAAWVPVLTDALDRGLVLRHATRGEQRAEDVVGNNAHDAHHHAWDISRSVAS